MCIRDRLSSVVMTIEKMSQNINEHKNNVDFKINEIENNCKTEIQALNESIAVSYTHLDVYKRQPNIHGLLPEICLFPC